MSVLYNNRKDNVAANALRRVTIGSGAHMVDDKKELVKEVN